MKNYLFREYSEDELNEIIKNTGAKIIKLNRGGYNGEYYEKILEFYNYLINLKNEKQRERRFYEKMKSNSDHDYIETDPVLKEYEKNMKEKMKQMEDQLSEDEDDC